MTILNFPYYLYPGTPCCEYTYIKEYNDELLRLHKEIINLLNNNDKILFHLTIGAAMEEYFTLDTKSDYNFQWQQLFPVHVRDHLNNGGEVIHYIVSPNENFCINKFVEPLFVSKCSDLKFKLIDDRHYVSQICNYQVKIFYTMMPHIDKRNTQLSNNLKKHFNGIINIDQYVQTMDDKIFIKLFYDDLLSLFNHIIKNDGLTTCFSFAVFNALGDKSHINNYQMFDEIKSCFKQNDCQLLAEWTFYLGSYIVRDLCNHNISYVNDIIDEFGEKIIIHNNKLAIKSVSQ